MHGGDGRVASGLLTAGNEPAVTSVPYQHVNIDRRQKAALAPYYAVATSSSNTSTSSKSRRPSAFNETSRRSRRASPRQLNLYII